MVRWRGAGTRQNERIFLDLGRVVAPREAPSAPRPVPV